jgi:hypothetical protein
MLEFLKMAVLQISGEMGALVALVIALGIAGVAIILITAKKR